MNSILAKYFGILALLLVICFYLYPIFSGHIKNSSNEYVFNDDARPQIAPFLDSYKADYFDQYYLKALHPVFYSLIYKSFTKFENPRILSKIFPYIILSLFLIYVFKIGVFLASDFLGFSLVILTVSTEIFFNRMVGALPHSFGFLIIASGILYILKQQYKKSLFVAIIGSGFYPACAVFIFFSTFTLFLFTQKIPKKKEVLFFVISFVICGLICLPQIIASSEYGGVVSAYETKQFSEAEIGGRNGELDIMNNDFTYSILFNLTSVFFQKYDFIINFSKAFLVLVLSILAIKILLKQTEYKYKILPILALNCLVLYFLAKIFSPILYFPERYIGYTLPLILLIIILTAANILLNNHLQKFNKSEVTILLISIILLILFKPQINDKTGLNIDETENKPLFEFIKTLPKNALIAGFPIGVMDSIKYLGNRNFYFNFETSVPIHKKHILEIRGRAKEFFKAYYATNLKTLKNFSNKTGVNYILVDEEKLDKQIPPQYYKPLGKIALKFFKKAKNKEFILKKLKNQAILQHNHYFLIKI